MATQSPRKPRVLFLSTANAARSQMAEAFLRFHAGDRFDIYSAGLEPVGIHPLTARVMEEAGFDLAGQWSKSVQEYLGRVHFGYLITVCDHAEANCPAAFLGMGQRIYWDFEDPAKFKGSDEETLAKFREVRDQVHQQIQTWLAEQAPSNTEEG